MLEGYGYTFEGEDILIWIPSRQRMLTIPYLPLCKCYEKLPAILSPDVLDLMCREMEVVQSQSNCASSQ